jgi:molybdopterin synthase catalytic subunit
LNDISIAIVDREKTSISLEKAEIFVRDATHGAVTFFLGIVRNHNLKKKVIAVTYDVFEAHAVKSFKLIALEAQKKIGKNKLKIFVQHAKGKLRVSDTSVIVAVGSAHRNESIKACEYIINEIKKRSPIWKMEHYKTGDGQWLQGKPLI